VTERPASAPRKRRLPKGTVGGCVKKEKRDQQKSCQQDSRMNGWSIEEVKSAAPRRHRDPKGGGMGKEVTLWKGEKEKPPGRERDQTTSRDQASCQRSRGPAIGTQKKGGERGGGSKSSPPQKKRRKERTWGGAFCRFPRGAPCRMRYAGKRQKKPRRGKALI